MTRNEKVEKREKAFRKLNNQISVLSRTVTKKDKKVVAKLAQIANELSIA